MKLKTMWIRGFRSLENVRIPFQPDLTVLIGENDSGKSSVLDLLEWILEAPVSRKTEREKRPKEADFSLQGERRVNKIEVKLLFEIPNESNSMPAIREEWLWGKKKEKAQTKRYFLLRVTYTFSEKEPLFEIYSEGWKWHTVKQLKVLDFLPRIQRYRALEYEHPEKFLEKTLKAVAASALYSLRDTKQKLKSVRDLEDRIRGRLSQEVKQLLGFVQRILPEARDIAYDPDIRLEESLRGGELLVDMGYGLHPLSRIGDGTKRRIVMAAMEWEREVLRRIGSTTPLLRAYDEPDTNLHYNAQRVFFRAVRDIVKENPLQQAILCTHSVFMIDAAPARCIVHLAKNTDGKTEVTTLPVDKDAEIARFLENVAFQMGVRNSVLFFDRCYLLVEGETEYYALPVLYRALYGHSMAEDGIAIINLGGEKSPAALFKLLERRARLVLFVLDADVSEARKDELKNQGWSDAQIENSIISIGDKEFEDVFPDKVWAAVAQQNWPRRDGQAWTDEMIRKVREGEDSINSGKFSEDLRNVIQRDAGIKGGLSKPEMGQKLAEYLSQNSDNIPQAIKDLFERARQIAGVEA